MLKQASFTIRAWQTKVHHLQVWMWKKWSRDLRETWAWSSLADRKGTFEIVHVNFHGKILLLFIQGKEVLCLVLNNEHVQGPIKWLTSTANIPSMSRCVTTIYMIMPSCYAYSKIPATRAFPGWAIVYKRQLPSSLLPVESLCLISNKLS